MEKLITTGEIAAMLGVPVWQIRRVVDGLGEVVPRAGQYRLVPYSLVPKIKAAIRDSEKEPVPA